MLIGATAAFVLVTALMGLALLSRREAAPASVALWLGWGGVGFVSAVLVGLLVYAFIVGERLAPSVPRDGVTITATGEQWRWRFGYGAMRSEDTEAVMVIPAGTPVLVEVAAADVIHSFWVPRLAGKIDAIPGHVNRIRLEASLPGEYAGICAEYCGIGHRAHGFRVIALDATGWQAFLAGAPPDALSPWRVR